MKRSLVLRPIYYVQLAAYIIAGAIAIMTMVGTRFNGTFGGDPLAAYIVFGPYWWMEMHATITLELAMFALIIRLRYGLIRSITIPLFAISFGDMMFRIPWFFGHWAQGASCLTCFLPGFVDLPVVIIEIGMMMVYLIWGYDSLIPRRFWGVLGAIGIFDVFWIAIGFPVNNYITPYTLTVMPNLMATLYWAVVIGGIFWATRSKQELPISSIPLSTVNR